MRLLLQLSLAAADDGAVLERADSCSSILSRRMLHVQRVVRRRRRAVRSRRVRHWLVRLLREHSFVAANCHADGRTDSRSDGRSDDRTDGHADYHADSRTDGRSDGRADGHADYRTDSKADGRSDGRADGRADCHADSRTDGRTDT
jgi:hypothetical protein